MNEELTEGKIKIYRENGARTMRRVIFEVAFSTVDLNTSVYTVAENPGDTVYLELDIYKPTQRRVELLEKDNALLEQTVERLMSQLDAIDDLCGEG